MLRIGRDRLTGAKLLQGAVQFLREAGPAAPSRDRRRWRRRRIARTGVPRPGSWRLGRSARKAGRPDGERRPRVPGVHRQEDFGGQIFRFAGIGLDALDDLIDLFLPDLDRSDAGGAEPACPRRWSSGSGFPACCAALPGLPASSQAGRAACGSDRRPCRTPRRFPCRSPTHWPVSLPEAEAAHRPDCATPAASAAGAFPPCWAGRRTPGQAEAGRSGRTSK